MIKGLPSFGEPSSYPDKGPVDLVRRRRRSVDLQSAHAAVGLQIQPTVTKSTGPKPGSDVGWEFHGLVMIRARWGQARSGARERLRFQESSCQIRCPANIHLKI